MFVDGIYDRVWGEYCERIGTSKSRVTVAQDGLTNSRLGLFESDQSD